MAVVIAAALLDGLASIIIMFQVLTPAEFGNYNSFHGAIRHRQRRLTMQDLNYRIIVNGKVFVTVVPSIVDNPVSVLYAAAKATRRTAGLKSSIMIKRGNHRVAMVSHDGHIAWSG